VTFQWRKRQGDAGIAVVGRDWPRAGGSVFEDADGRWIASAWRPSGENAIVTRSTEAAAKRAVERWLSKEGTPKR